jgi:hypothetical protein
MYLSCSGPPDSAPHRDEREAAQFGQPSSAPARGRERYGKNGMMEKYSWSYPKPPKLHHAENIASTA